MIDVIEALDFFSQNKVYNPKISRGIRVNVCMFLVPMKY